jgi:hypothetical protein
MPHTPVAEISTKQSGHIALGFSSTEGVRRIAAVRSARAIVRLVSTGTIRWTTGRCGWQ